MNIAIPPSNCTQSDPNRAREFATRHHCVQGGSGQASHGLDLWSSYQVHVRNTFQIQVRASLLLTGIVQLSEKGVGHARRIFRIQPGRLGRYSAFGGHHHPSREPSGLSRHTTANADSANCMILCSPYSQSQLGKKIPHVAALKPSVTKYATCGFAKVALSSTLQRDNRRVASDDFSAYLPFSTSGGALLFHLLSKLYKRTSVVIAMNSP